MAPNDWVQQLEQKTSNSFNAFINKMDGLSANQYQGVYMNDIPSPEDLLTLNFLLHDTDIVDGNIVAEIARENAQRYENTVQLLSHNHHIYYVNNINAVIQFFAALILTLFSTEPSFLSNIQLHGVNERKCLSDERMSNPRNSL